VLLFVMLLAIFAYTPPRWQDWNQNSRFDLTRAIVEQRSLRIDDYASNTGDFATVDGHIYSDKAPGLSLAAAPVYALTRAARPLGLSWVSERLGESGAFSATLNPDGAGTSRERIDVAVALSIATIVCVAIPAALMLVLLALVVTRLAGCRTAGILTALLIGLATPVFTYAQAFYGHVPAAACVVAALAVLVLRGDQLRTRELAGVGALLGLAVLIEFPAAVAGLPIALWAVWLAGRRAVVYGVLGALPPLAVLGAYDLAAFGTILPVGYEHSTLWQEQHQTGFMSLTYPRWDALWGMTGSPFRGLFLLAPVLLLAVPGALLALRGARTSSGRQATLVSLAGFAAMFLFTASSVMWWGGFAVGPRYLVPALPLLAVPLGFVIARINGAAFPHRAAGMALVAILGSVSPAQVWALTFARQNYPPDSIDHPIIDYALPALRDGDVARNAGMVLQLGGISSLVPLLIITCAGVAAIALQLVRPDRVPA
jgi:hypothetical protein